MPAKQANIPERFTADWLTKLDGRTNLAKAVQGRLHALYVDLGGESALSYQERSLCRRVVWLEAVVERREAELARGEDVDEARHVANINTLTGLLKAVGLERRARDIPSLGEYLKQREAAG